MISTLINNFNIPKKMFKIKIRIFLIKYSLRFLKFARKIEIFYFNSCIFRSNCMSNDIFRSKFFNVICNIIFVNLRKYLYFNRYYDRKISIADQNRFLKIFENKFFTPVTIFSN